MLGRDDKPSIAILLVIVRKMLIVKSRNIIQIVRYVDETSCLVIWMSMIILIWEVLVL